MHVFTSTHNASKPTQYSHLLATLVPTSAQSNSRRWCGIQPRTTAACHRFDRPALPCSATFALLSFLHLARPGDGPTAVTVCAFEYLREQYISQPIPALPVARYAVLSQMAESGMRCVQAVTVVGPPPGLAKFTFNVQLSKVDVAGVGECWLIDAVARDSS